MSYARSYCLNEPPPRSEYSGRTVSPTPEPFDQSSRAKTSEYARHDKPNAKPDSAAVRKPTNPIHHQIAPALAAPFMNAEGLIHRGTGYHASTSNSSLTRKGHLVHRYEDGTESPFPVTLKSLGDGTVMTRNFPSI